MGARKPPEDLRSLMMAPVSNQDLEKMRGKGIYISLTSRPPGLNLSILSLALHDVQICLEPGDFCTVKLQNAVICVGHGHGFSKSCLETKIYVKRQAFSI